MKTNQLFFRSLVSLFLMLILATGTQAQYCVAPHLNPCSAADNIDGFSIIITNFNNSGTGCTNSNGNAYTIYAPGPGTTCNFRRDSTYYLNVSTTTDNIVSLWVDWDQNGVFDASEWTQLSTSTTNSPISFFGFHIPNTAKLGPTGMRLRSRLVNNTNDALSACSTFGSGETEDYTVTITPGPAVNNNPANATLLIPSTTCNPITGSVTGASQEVSFSCGVYTYSPPSLPDVWYKFVPDSTNVEIRVTGTTTYAPFLSLWQGPGTGSMNCASTFVSGGTAKISATGLTVGNTYYVAVHESSSNNQDFSICVINSSNDLATVTFDLDITPAITSQVWFNNGPPEIMGTFNGFSPNDDMTPVTSNLFRKSYSTMKQGDSIQFKFRINHNWSTVEATSKSYIVNNGDTVKCYWDSSFTVIDATYKLPMTFRVNMSNQTVSPDGVYMVGNFNDYDPDSTQMTAIGNGVYEATVDLDTSSFIRYRFVNGLLTSNSETVAAACGLFNASGFYERFLAIPEVADTMNTVCFNECNDCIGFADVTFRVDVQFISPNAAGIHLAGTFNNWDYGSTMMFYTGSNTYEATLHLDTSTSIRYKFVNGNTSADAEIVPSACGIIQGGGGYKRNLNVPENNSILPVICFGQCGDCGPLGVNETAAETNDIKYLTSSDQIEMHLSPAFRNATLSLFDGSGKLQWQEAGKSRDEVSRISAAFLVSGIYTIELKSAGHAVYKKLVIVK